MAEPSPLSRYKYRIRREDFLKKAFEFIMGSGRSPLPFLGTSTEKLKRLRVNSD